VGAEQIRPNRGAHAPFSDHRVTVSKPSSLGSTSSDTGDAPSRSPCYPTSGARRISGLEGGK
jgi:hypothetical protein